MNDDSAIPHGMDWLKRKGDQWLMSRIEEARSNIEEEQRVIEAAEHLLARREVSCRE